VIAPKIGRWIGWRPGCCTGKVGPQLPRCLQRGWVGQFVPLQMGSGHAGEGAGGDVHASYDQGLFGNLEDWRRSLQVLVAPLST